MNSDFAKNFSQEIEKDNFLRMQGIETTNNLPSKDNIFAFGNNVNKQLLKRESDLYKQSEDSIGKISSYDYNNFYFNRCLGI